MAEELKIDAGGHFSPWQTRIESANKFYGDWEGKFKCKLMEEYYEGFQWKQRRDYPTTNYNPYTLNLIYSTIKIKLSSLLFQKPQYIVGPKPGNSNWNEEFAVQSAQLKEDVLNTIVSNPSTNFTKHCKLAALDSFFRFGVVEIGYANDWRNPQKIDPKLKSWDEPLTDFDDDKIVQENDIPINERFYIKRIRPTRFRVSVSEATDLADHDWCGYYDYYYTRVLANTKGINWPENRTGGSYVSAEYANGFIGSDKEDLYRQLYVTGEISRVWHIWDQVAKKRLLILDDDEFHVLYETDFVHLPLVDLRWDFRLKGFYPLPPVFQWLSPQDEINEAREQTRSYRRRFTRKFQSLEGSVSEEEKEKFASGPDGIVIGVKQLDAIKPIDNPEQGPTAENALIIAKDDFNIISGTSAEARGQNTDRETATQAKLVDARSQIRESAEQLDFSVWLELIGQELLTQLEDNLETGLWIKYTANPSADPAQNDPTQNPEMPVYQYITRQQIKDGYDYEVNFDIQNATPAAMQAAQQSFVNFMSLLANFPMISLSPSLIREAAYRVGYRNEMIIKQAQQAAQTQAQMQAQQIAQGPQAQQAQQTGKGKNTARRQMATPNLSELASQLGVQ